MVSDDDDDSIDALTFTTFYPDVDEDGSGNPEGAMDICDQPDGYVNNASDCDDSNANVAASCTDEDGDTFYVEDAEDTDCDDTATLAIASLYSISKARGMEKRVV